MCGDDAQRLGVVAVGQRHARVGTTGQRCGDAGHDLERDAVARQHFEFLAAATEHEWIAALEPHDAAPRPGMLEHQLVDPVLGDGVGARGLADRHPRRVAPRESQHLLRHQPVVQDHVRLLQGAHRTQGQQSRIPRTRAHQHHRAASGRGTRNQ